MTALWPDTFVEEANLAFQISTLRKALGESGEDGWLIDTFPKHGYRFVATVARGRERGEGDPPVERSSSQSKGDVRNCPGVRLVGVTGVGLYRFLDRSRSSTSGSGVGPVRPGDPLPRPRNPARLLTRRQADRVRLGWRPKRTTPTYT